MGFNFENKGFDFSPQSKQKTGKKAKEPTTDYQERNKKEQDRFKLATCSNFFSIVCFNKEEEKQTFQKLLGEEKQFYSCIEVEEFVATFPTHKRDWKVKEKITKADFERWEDPPTFEGICQNDLEHLLTLFNLAKSKKVGYVLDSPHFFVLVAKDDEDMQRFLTENKLFRYGDRFLDGSSWLADIS